MSGKVWHRDSVDPRGGGTAVDPPFVPLLQSFTLKCYIDCTGRAANVYRGGGRTSVDAHELQTEC